MIAMNYFTTCLLILSLLICTDAFVVRPTGRSFPIALPMVAVDTSEIKNGMTVELDGDPCKVLSFSIMKQARGAAKTTIKFKNLVRGTTIENTYRSGEKFETALIEKMDAQFTYQEGVRVFC
jgi:Elongation factor P (EF-P) KOW-like domain